MYLKNLLITKNTGDVIRDIPFKMGLNLIVGLSNDSGSSNSLGKTTLVRCINFCLAGKVEEFFIDSESKNIENTTIKNFLIKNEITFQLILGKSLNEDSVSDLKISRQVKFDLENEKIIVINKINNDECSFDDFQSILKIRLFKTDVTKPSFRNLITKFVRRTDVEVNNILKYLNTFTTNIDYTTLRFFLFGFSEPEIIETKQFLEKELAKINKHFKALKAIIPEGTQQKIDLLQVELKDKEQLRDSFQIEYEYKIDENELAKIEQNINQINSVLSNLHADKSTLLNRLEKIRSDRFKDNVQNIKYLYEEAKLLNIKVQKSFEDTIIFHNSMLKNEETYLISRIDKIAKEIQYYESIWSDYTLQYNQVLEKLSRQGALAEYTKLNEQITHISSEISEKKSLIVQLEELSEVKNSINAQLSNISSKLDNKIEYFQKVNIPIFNLYFSKYSEKLYNEKWYVTFDPDGTSYKFDVQAFESNAGSGKKQTLVAAFDIAYMAFIQDKEINLPYPRFATQDKIEVIDIEEIEQLANLVLQTNGQLITPIIQDKFKNFKVEDIEDKVLLRLTPSDKFFRL
ncbi:AAA family ATPase [Acinetobacter baylyi]|uniref:AAA family ATPase n=1 Tax=Acinetobacter baylyi TaxID=202950 RepID=UPI0031D3E587